METERSSDSSEQTLTASCGEKKQTKIDATKMQLMFLFLTSESFSAVEVVSRIFLTSRIAITKSYVLRAV
jgi:hypothetical protein